MTTTLVVLSLVTRRRKKNGSSQSFIYLANQHGARMFEKESISNERGVRFDGNPSLSRMTGINYELVHWHVRNLLLWDGRRFTLSLVFVKRESSKPDVSVRGEAGARPGTMACFKAKNHAMIKLSWTQTRSLPVNRRTVVHGVTIKYRDII